MSFCLLALQHIQFIWNHLPKAQSPHPLVDCLPHWDYQFLPGQPCSLLYFGQGGVHPSQYRYSPQHLLGICQEGFCSSEKSGVAQNVPHTNGPYCLGTEQPAKQQMPKPSYGACDRNT